MKKIFIFDKYDKCTPWIKHTFDNIKKFIDYEKGNYELTDNLEDCKNSEVYVIGYKTSEIANLVIERQSNGDKIHIIENLCCDDSLKAHRSACDKLFLNGISRNRNFNFLNEEIKKVVSKIISDKNGYNTKIEDNASLIRYGLDSLDMIVIVDEIEDNFNVEISTISLTKPMRVSEMSKLLETGFIGRKFEK